jgi:hypothetical protein
VRLITRKPSLRGPVHRAVEALEIGGCGIATSIAGFVLGLQQPILLVAIYAVTVVAAYALVGCLEGARHFAQPGND